MILYCSQHSNYETSNTIVFHLSGVKHEHAIILMGWTEILSRKYLVPAQTLDNTMVCAFVGYIFGLHDS